MDLSLVEIDRPPTRPKRVLSGMTKVDLPGAKESRWTTSLTMATDLKSLASAAGQFGKNRLAPRSLRTCATPLELLLRQAPHALHCAGSDAATGRAIPHHAEGGAAEPDPRFVQPDEDPADDRRRRQRQEIQQILGGAPRRSGRPALARNRYDHPRKATA